MDIIVKRTEDYFTKGTKRDLMTKDTVKKYLKMNEGFEALEAFRFCDDYETLSEKIYKSLKGNPLLLNEVKKISNKIHIDASYLTQISSKLSMTSNNKINICTGITGFDCAAGAYGDTIYFGLEWFCNPDIVGIERSDYRYKFMASLNESLDEFLVESIPHEMVHIVSKKPDKDNNMFRFLEEGRACYVTHLLFPEWSLYKVIPMENSDIDYVLENETKFIETAYHLYNQNPEEAIKKMFSPTGEIMGIGLSGYYIAYMIFKERFSRELDIDYRMKSIIEFTDCDELLNNFRLMSNS